MLLSALCDNITLQLERTIFSSSINLNRALFVKRVILDGESDTNAVIVMVINQTECHVIMFIFILRTYRVFHSKH